MVVHPKGPVAYPLPAHRPAQDDPVHDLLTEGMTWSKDVYEPEVHAFGGPDSMTTAHALFHGDSRHLIAFLAGNASDRRERSLLLLTTFMRAARLDWMEQGDVWAQVAEQRAPLLSEPSNPTAWTEYVNGVRQLLLGTAHPGALPGGWLAVFQSAGSQMRQIRERGDLSRGIRAVTAFHVIHHWNRIGIPGSAQALLAKAAKKAILGSV